MAFLEFVVGFFGLILLAILINFAVFLYKLCLYGKNERIWFWPAPEQNSVQMTEVSIPCTISAQVSATEGLGPNRRLSELLVRDGQLVLINYAADNGKVLVKKMSAHSEGHSSSTQQYYEDLPPSYNSCVFP